MTENHLLLFRLAELMLEQEHHILPVDFLFDDEQIGDFVKSIQIDSPYQQMLLEGVLTETVNDEKLYVSFTVEGYFHYVLGEVMESNYLNLTEKEIYNILSKNNLNGINEGLEHLLIRKVDKQEFDDLFWFIDFGDGFTSSTVDALCYALIKSGTNTTDQNTSAVLKSLFETPTNIDVDVIHDVINKLEKLQKKDVLTLIYRNILQCIEPNTPKKAEIFVNATDYLNANEKIEKLDQLTTLNFNENNIETVNLYNSIGSEWDKLGQYAKSIIAFNKAKSAISIIKEKHQNVNAEILNNLGIALQHEGRLEESLNHYKASLEIYTKLLGSKHSAIATIYNNMGLLFQNKGNYDEAIKYYQKALDRDEMFYGNYHSNTATTINNIGSLYLATGKYDDAKLYYEKSLRIFLQIFGEVHQLSATSYNNLSLVYIKQKKFTQALECSQKALNIIEEVFGLMHPWYATTVSNIGGIYLESGDLENALVFFSRGLELKREIFEEGHSSIGISLYNIAKCHHDSGGVEQAQKYYHQALNICIKSLGDKHPYTIRIKDNLAKL